MNLSLKSVLLILSCTVTFVSCQKKAEPGDSTVSAKEIKNVAYGSDPFQTMDIYLPAGRSETGTKVLILIHGGGWNTGDKSDFNSYIDSLKKREPGYAIFNINYRLATGTANFFPTQEQDVKAAFEFIVSKSAEYKISQKIALLGASAGAHLALLQAYKYDSPVKVKAVIDFFGPTDLAAMYNNPPDPLVPLLLALVTGQTPSSNPALYTSSSPLNFVTATSPPTIILQGGADLVVSPSQSELLRDKLTGVYVANQYVFYPAEGHGWFNANLVDSFDKIQAFLAAHVN